MAENMMIPFDDNDNKDSIRRDGEDSELGDDIRTLAGHMKDFYDLLERTHKKVEKVRTDVTETAAQVSELDKRVTDIEDNGFVDDHEAEQILAAVKNRVSVLLGIRWQDGCVVDECMYDYKRYYSKFARALHGSAKRVGLEGGKYHHTRKKNYLPLLEYIAKWVPLRGVEGTKEYYDMLERIS